MLFNAIPIAIAAHANRNLDVDRTRNQSGTIANSSATFATQPSQTVRYPLGGRFTRSNDTQYVTTNTKHASSHHTCDGWANTRPGATDTRRAPPPERRDTMRTLPGRGRPTSPFTPTHRPARPAYEPLSTAQEALRPAGEARSGTLVGL